MKTHPSDERGRRGAQLLALAMLLAGARSGRAAQDVGFQGPSIAGAGPTIGSPSVTASKPQSKLWFHAGSWWGSLWSASAHAFRIHRLAPGSQAWIDTGVAIDARPDSHSDALWNGTKLYIATHEFGQGAGGPSHAILVLRFSDTGAGFVLDTGFPVTIGNSGTESLVIDQDSTGRLWVAWMQGLRVRITHSLGSDSSWTAPVILPGCTSNVTSDDICSLVAFGGNRIGVMWSDRTLDRFNFAVHVDGAADTSWQPVELALGGGADDHIDLAADSAGRVLAVVKDDTDDLELLVRGAGGGWQVFPVAAGSDNLTRPIVLLDEGARRVHVFAARQGAIRRKTSSLDAIAFPAGSGTLVMRDADGTLNDPTSTKQNLLPRTGLVVLAANTVASGHYWHHEVRGPSGRIGLVATAAAGNLISISREITLAASGASAGRWVRFSAVGVDVPGPPRTLGFARADETGTARLHVAIPPALAGTSWRIQVVEARAPRSGASVLVRF